MFLEPTQYKLIKSYFFSLIVDYLFIFFKQLITLSFSFNYLRAQFFMDFHKANFTICIWTQLFLFPICIPTFKFKWCSSLQSLQIKTDNKVINIGCIPLTLLNESTNTLQALHGANLRFWACSLWTFPSEVPVWKRVTIYNKELIQYIWKPGIVINYGQTEIIWKN